MNGFLTSIEIIRYQQFFIFLFVLQSDLDAKICIENEEKQINVFQFLGQWRIIRISHRT